MHPISPVSRRMIRRTRTLLAGKTLAGTALLTLAALVSLGLAETAMAQDAMGPEFGKSRFETTIRPLNGQPDLDDFQGRLLKGESLSVTISPGKRSSLRPNLRLFDPNGVERTLVLKFASANRKVSLKKYPIDVTGSWVVRVEGASLQTLGAYVAAFKIGAAGKSKRSKQPLGATDVPIAIDGLDGGLLTLKLVSSKKGEVVQVRSLKDPSGNDVPSPPAKALDLLEVKKNKAKWKKLPLSTGDGVYSLVLGIDQGTATYNLIWSVTPGPRPKSKKAIVLAESEDPLLDPVEQPFEGSEGVVVRITGRNLVDSQQVLFDGVPGTVVAADPSRRWIDVHPPVGTDNSVVSIRIVSTDAQAVQLEDHFRYVPLMTLSGSTITAGPVIGSREVPLAGGNTLHITGTNLDLMTDVRLAGASATFVQRTASSFDVIVPAGSAGLTDLEIEDHLGRTVGLTAVIHRVGFIDSTTSRTPASSAADDFSAWRGAIGDLDNDTVDDDIAIGSYNALTQYEEAANSPGTRGALTRGLRFTTAYTLVDIGDDGPATSAASDWNVVGLAVGDLDGNAGDEIVLAGGVGVDVNGYAGSTDGSHLRFTVWFNDGLGVFSAPAADQPPVGNAADVQAETELTTLNEDTNEQEPVFQSIRTARTRGAVGTSIVLGDLDGDGDLDIVAGSSAFSEQTVGADPSYVDYSSTPPYLNSADIHLIDTTYYDSATRIFRNDLSTNGGFVDVTTTKMPNAGDDKSTPKAAFRARDIALGDLDGDGYLDMTVAWSNPAGTTPLGSRSSFQEYVFFYNTRFHRYIYSSAQAPVTATRVLINDRSGGFTDSTDSWMPAPVTGVHEYWQAHQVELADFDGDGDLDMALQHRRGLDAFRGQGASLANSSLRILRNDRINVDGTPVDAFVDVTSTSLPAFPVDTDDNYRGAALGVRDVNGDGHLDLVFGTREKLQHTSNGQVRSLHVMFGRGDLTFQDGSPFLPPFSTDSGEVDAVVLSNLASSVEMLFLLSEVMPTNSTAGQHMRAFDWVR